MDEQMTLDGSSLLERTRPREASSVFLNEETVRDGGEPGTNSSTRRAYDWKIRSLPWWSGINLSVCAYSEKGEFRSSFFFCSQAVNFSSSSDYNSKKANGKLPTQSVYSRKFRHIWKGMKTKCSILLNQMYLLRLLWLLGLLVKFHWTMDWTAKSTFMFPLFKSRSNVWKLYFLIS